MLQAPEALALRFQGVTQLVPVNFLADSIREFPA